jgi:hypothetical protein
MHRNPRQGIPRPSDIVFDHRILDDDISRIVVGHEEDRRTESVHLVAFEPAPAQRQGHGVSVIVNGAPTAAARAAWLQKTIRQTPIQLIGCACRLVPVYYYE